MNERRRGAVGILLAVSTLAVPAVGILLLNFYFSGPSEAELAQAASARTPVVTAAVAAPAGLPTPAPRPTFTRVPTATPTPPPSPTDAPAPIPTATAITTPSPTETVTPPRAVVPGMHGTVNATDGLRVREGPSTDTRVIRVARFEEELVLSGSSVQQDEIQWVQLGGEGWVQARYLDFEGA